ncbi:hypothetical protein JCM11251_001429 [Rhodosporidiobolus azoricus]
MAEYELYYHAGGFPGRGEFIRLLFEATGTAYKDSALDGQEPLMPYLDGTFPGNDKNPHPFAPPVLKHGDIVISQTPNILLYLATHLSSPIDLESSAGGGEPANKKTKASPASFDEAATWHAHALALTMLDMANEAHDTHHPVAVSQYYEDQKDVALLRAKSFREERFPKFFKNFEGNLQRSSGDFLLSSGPTYADLVLFQLVDGLKYAFPVLLRNARSNYPKIEALYERIKSAPRIKQYLESERRQQYGPGLFRHYEELDEKE